MVRSIKSYPESGSDGEFGDPRLGELVRLLERCEPEQIILFGSRARGDADEYSDYDIIVIKRTDKPLLPSPRILERKGKASKQYGRYYE